MTRIALLYVLCKTTGMHFLVDVFGQVECNATAFWTMHNYCKWTHHVSSTSNSDIGWGIKPRICLPILKKKEKKLLVNV